MLRLISFAVMTFLWLVPSAGAGDILADGVPLPGDARVVVQLATPANLSRFSGAWVGAWDGQLKHVLIVETVSADGSAEVVYALGGEAEPRIQRSWNRHKATIAGDTLRLDEGFASYVMTAAGMLRADYRGPDGTSTALMRKVDLIGLAGSGTAIGRDARPAASEPAAAKQAACVPQSTFGFAEPDAQAVNPETLLKLTRWVGNHQAPIFSVLISRHGKIVYELYTSGIDRDQAHFLMSVTKSVTSALAGIALDKKLLRDPEMSISEALPRSAFPNKEAYQKFRRVSLKDAMGMSALDVPLEPQALKGEAAARSAKFYDRALRASQNRLTVALSQNLLPRPGIDFRYSSITPILVAGAVQYAARMSLLDFAKKSLFGPMQFENEEWMHQDSAGIDSPGYGLRLRPIDMQKFGILYLNKGCWEGRQLISSSWVERSFQPWIKSDRGYGGPNYGWYWWQDHFGLGWTGHIANGWQGQRIAVFPDRDVVVTMTGAIDDGSEDGVFADIMYKFVIPAVEVPLRADAPVERIKGDLKVELLNVLNGPPRFAKDLEFRLRPQKTAKEGHRPFTP